MKFNRDELAAVLKAGYRSIILEADDWRPLADHVISLIEVMKDHRDVDWCAAGGFERNFKPKHLQEYMNREVQITKESERQLNAKLWDWLEEHPDYTLDCNSGIWCCTPNDTTHPDNYQGSTPKEAVETAIREEQYAEGRDT
jgi:hypothetical protein